MRTKLVGPTLSVRTRLPELQPDGTATGTVAYPVQLIVYGPTEPEVIEGTAIEAPEGDVEILLPIAAPPAEGTPVQVILYPTGEPTVLEGRVGRGEVDGSFDIILTR